MSGEAAQQPASIIDLRSVMMVKLQTFTTVFLNCMEMKVSLTCVPCLGGSFACDMCFQRFADPIMSILDQGKVIFQPVDDLIA